jgi:hypothetical protein
MMMAQAAAAADPDDAPICTDRPAKGNGVCTVPAGRFQIETGLVDWVVTDEAGVRTEVATLGQTFAKLGLSDRSDLQIGFTPLVRVDVTEAGERTHLSGLGDVIVRYKYRLSADDAGLQIGVIPFLKLPTAKKGIGNRKVEGGVAVPLSFPLGKATMTLGPEVDLLADADGSGRHVALVNLANVSAPVASKLTAAIEVWSSFNVDPARTVKQASADAALAYALSRDLQLDVGANIGLTRDTPDFESYAGVSVRF